MEKLFPNEEIIDTKNFNVHQDWETPILGFFIIRAKRKIKSISDFTEEEITEFFNTLSNIRRGMKNVLGIDEVILFQNEGSKYDFHLWIFPVHPWMERFGKGIRSIGPIKDYAEEKLAIEENILEIKNSVKKMREFMKK